jgi:hypothetical protein
MKVAIISVLSLVIGIGAGWYFGYTRPNAQANRELQEKMDVGAVPDDFAASFAVDAINRIDAGDTRAAIQHLSLPIIHFVFDCRILPSTNKDRLQLLRSIDELIRTNQIVAAQITNRTFDPFRYK